MADDFQSDGDLPLTLRRLLLKRRASSALLATGERLNWWGWSIIALGVLCRVVRGCMPSGDPDDVSDSLIREHEDSDWSAGHRRLRWIWSILLKGGVSGRLLVFDRCLLADIRPEKCPGGKSDPRA